MYFSLQTNPLLIRVDTKAGHGFGKPTAKIVSLIILHRVLKKFFGFRNLPYLKASVWAFKEKWGRDSDRMYARDVGWRKEPSGLRDRAKIWAGTMRLGNHIGDYQWLKHTYQLRGVAITLRMRTTVLPRQWQPWIVASPLLGLFSMT